MFLIVGLGLMASWACGEGRNLPEDANTPLVITQFSSIEERYEDDFSTNLVTRDSCVHSKVVPNGGADPRYEPFLSYVPLNGNQRLVMTGYNGEPAILSYCLPSTGTDRVRAMTGTLRVTVDTVPPISGESYLYLSTSRNGQDWSLPQALEQNRTHNIVLPTYYRTLLVVLTGHGVAIDNFAYTAGIVPASLFVPGHAATIQAAIDQATDGDVIEVAPGEYTGPGNRALDFRGKSITVRSAVGPTETVINCEGSTQRGVYFHQGESAHSILEGFSITGGRTPLPADDIPQAWESWTSSANHPVGGGIFCENSSPTILNCRIFDSQATYGGGIGCVGGQPTIVNCVVQNCSSDRGGGLALLRSSRALIEDTTIWSNSAPNNGLGGGLFIEDNVTPAGATDRNVTEIRSCRLGLNEAIGNGSGGGLYATGDYLAVRLQNCIVAQNTAAQGPGLYAEELATVYDPSKVSGKMWNLDVLNCTIAHNETPPGVWAGNTAGMHGVGGYLRIKNSILYFNAGQGLKLVPGSNGEVSYSNVQGGSILNGTIDENPGFISSFPSPCGLYDYRLSNWSSCIDTGDPYDPVYMEPNPNGRRINMGAYGGTALATQGGTVWHVDTQRGWDSAIRGTGRDWPFKSIEFAEGKAQDGDVVLIWPGVYTTEGISLDDKSVSFQGATDPPVIQAPGATAFAFHKQNHTVFRNLVISESHIGIYCQYSSPTIANLTLLNNGVGIIGESGSQPIISNCILWSNQKDLEGVESQYSRLSNGWGTNISTDPLFANVDIGDYHLLSQGGRYDVSSGQWQRDFISSPCLDAGNMILSSAREPLPNGGRINMGAYGGTPYASKSPLSSSTSGDLNSDLMIGVLDQWLHLLPWTANSYELENFINMNLEGTEGVLKTDLSCIIGP